MKINQLIAPFAISALALAVYSCVPSPTPAGSTKTTVGTITGFGSVFVAGVEFDTTGTEIMIDGKKVTQETELDPGMKVVIKSNEDGTTSKAVSIDYDAEVEGVVISNNIGAGATTGTMDVMGQTITVDGKTRVESNVPTVASVDLITPGMVVEISGHSDGNGNITATYIEIEAPDLTTYTAMHPEGIEVQGKISGLNETNKTFMIGGLTVSYASFNPPFQLRDGLLVEVSSLAPVSTAGVLAAETIEIEGDGENEYEMAVGDSFYIEGEVDTLPVAGVFELNGQTVRIDGSTVFIGMTEGDIAVGVELEVDGIYNAAGEVVAEQVEMEREADNEVVGIVDAVTKDGTNTGTITIGTVTASITNDTIMEDSTAADGTPPVEMFNLQSVQVGDVVAIYFYTEGTGGSAVNVATVLERGDLL